MLGIVRPTDRHGLRGGPRRDQTRLDPPYVTLPRSLQPEMRARRRDRTEVDSTGQTGYATPISTILSFNTPTGI